MAPEESQGVTADTTDATTVDATVEQTTEVETPTTEQSTEDVTDEAATSEEAETEQTETSEESSDGEEASAEELAPKSQNRFQKLANENRVLKDKIAQLEQLQVPSEQDYIEGGYEPIEAKVNALEAQLQQSQAIERISSLNASVDNDMARIIHEYPALDPKNPDFKKDLAISIFTQYDKDASVQYADDGIVLEANRLPYEYVKEKMELIGLASRDAKVEAQKSVEKMVSVAETPAGSPPKEAKDMSIEEMEAKYGIVRY
jgi:hypothetical protein